MYVCTGENDRLEIKSLNQIKSNNVYNMKNVL